LPFSHCSRLKLERGTRQLVYHYPLYPHIWLLVLVSKMPPVKQYILIKQNCEYYFRSSHDRLPLSTPTRRQLATATTADLNVPEVVPAILTKALYVHYIGMHIKAFSATPTYWIRIKGRHIRHHLVDDDGRPIGFSVPAILDHLFGTHPNSQAVQRPR
jgi:hypothetical protein